MNKLSLKFLFLFSIREPRDLVQTFGQRKYNNIIYYAWLEHCLKPPNRILQQGAAPKIVTYDIHGTSFSFVMVFSCTPKREFRIFTRFNKAYLIS